MSPIKELSFVGSYYDVGKELGTATKHEVRQILNTFKESSIYKTLQHHLHSTDEPNVSTVLAGFEKLTEKFCPEIVSELRGIADGSGVEYRELFLLNLEPEWVALFSHVPTCNHGTKYGSTFDGCTNIYLPVPGTQQKYLGHTEDVCPAIRHCGYLVHHTIYNNEDSSEEPAECFTEYILPGILAGSKFGFNSHGLMYGHNNVYQQGLNKSGIPRRFLFRALVSSRSVEDAIDKVKIFPGIATGYTFNCLYMKTSDGEENVEFGGFEVAGEETGNTLIEKFYPTGVYIHCNTFQHLKYNCHPEESSLRRLAVLKNLMSRGQLKNQSDLVKALSNQEDTEYPLYRSGTSPDYLGTGATGIFDASTMTMTVYGDRPDSCNGQIIYVLKGDKSR